MTQATEVEELPGREPGRAAKIAAIHALAEWYADHPEIDMPDDIDCAQVHHRRYSSDDTDRLEEGPRVDQVLRFAVAQGVAPYEGATSVQAKVVVLARDVHGIGITHTVAAIKDGSGGRTYVL